MALGGALIRCHSFPSSLVQHSFGAVASRSTANEFDALHHVTRPDTSRSSPSAVTLNSFSVIATRRKYNLVLQNEK